MVKEYTKLFIQLFPSNIQNKIFEKYTSFSRNKVLTQWKTNGCPLPVPHEVKQLTIEYYQKKSKSKILVETGTYLGSMIYSQRNHFKKIYSIELSAELWKNAEKKFKEFSHIELLQGDSGNVLKTILPRLDSKTIFWLDGHYSGGITAKGDKNCPVYEELEAIFGNNLYKHVILIDDAFLFNGKDDYPTIDALEKFIKEKSPDYSLQIKHEIIILTAEK